MTAYSEAEAPLLEAEGGNLWPGHLRRADPGFFRCSSCCFFSGAGVSPLSCCSSAFSTSSSSSRPPTSAAPPLQWPLFSPPSPSSSSSSSSSPVAPSCFSSPSSPSPPHASSRPWRRRRRPNLGFRSQTRGRPARRGPFSQALGPSLVALAFTTSSSLRSATAAACKAVPECSDQDEVVIRAWAALDGRYQKVCTPSDHWASDCTFECTGNLAELRYLAAHFASVDIGVLAGVGGLVVQTTDGGSDWTSIQTDSSRDFHGVHTTPSGTIWVVGEGSIFGQGALIAQGGPTSTTGPGAGTASGSATTTTTTTSTATTTTTTSYVWSWTWREELTLSEELVTESDASQALYAVFFYGEELGWVVGSSGRTYRTVDAGSTWELRTWENGQTHYAVHFADSEFGLIAGTNGRALWSSTGGVTWAVRKTYTNATLRGAACINGTHGFVAGDAGTLLRTTDSGKTWSQANTSVILPTMHFTGVSFAGGNVGFAVGVTEAGLGVVAATQDGGVTWQVDHRTGLLAQTLHAVATIKVEVPRCTSDGATVTTTTTTENAAANEMVEAEYMVLTSVGTNDSGTARASASNSVGVVMAQRVLASSADEVGEISVRAASSSTVAVKLARGFFDELEMNETIVLISEFVEGSTAWDPDALGQASMESEDGVEAMFGQAVTVNIAINGAVAPVSGLANPIQITLLDERPKGYMCAFWNVTTKKWSDDGISQVIDPDAPSALVCSTTHLTTFAAVLKEVVTGISDSFFCTSVEVFSSRGWEATGNGLTCHGQRCLLARPYFWAFVLFLAMQAFLYRRARQRHETWLLVGMWKPSSFLVEIPSFKGKRKSCCRRLRESKRKFVEFWKDFKHHGSVLSARTCILSTASRKLGISSDDLESLLEWAQKTVEHTARLHRRLLKQQILAEQSKRKKKKKITTVGITIDSETVKGEAILETSRNSKLLGFVPTIYECLEQEAADYFEALQVGNRQRLWRFVSHIAVAGNPWAKLRYFCIAVDAPEQLLLLTGQIIISVTAAAMWLRGDSVDDLADERCKSAAQIGRLLGDALGITLATLLLAAVPRLLFGQLCRRKFVFKEAWSDDDIEDQVWRWRAKSACAFFLYGLLMFIGVLYCTSLLANVSGTDGLKWFFNFAWSIIFLCVYPLACGLLAVLVSMWTATHFLERSLQDDVRASLRLKVKGSAAPGDEEAGDLGSLEEEGEAAGAAEEETSPTSLGTPTSSLPSPGFSSPTSTLPTASPTPPGKLPRQRLTGTATQVRAHRPSPTSLRQAAEISTPPLSPSAGWTPSAGGNGMGMEGQEPLPSRQFPEALPPVDLAGMSQARSGGPVVH